MNPLRIVLALSAFCFICNALVGCATPYQKLGTSITGGYQYQRLTENAFTVSFLGNGFTSPTRASDFALLRAAEIALEHNYAYFTILGDRDLSGTDNVQIHHPSYSTGTLTSSGGTAFVNTTTTGGGVTNITIHKPGSEITIRCFESPPGGHAGIVLNANETATRIRDKYRLE